MRESLYKIDASPLRPCICCGGGCRRTGDNWRPVSLHHHHLSTHASFSTVHWSLRWGASEQDTLTDIPHPRCISRLVELSGQKADVALQSFISFYDVKTAAYFLSPLGAVPCPFNSWVIFARRVYGRRGVEGRLCSVEWRTHNGQATNAVAVGRAR